MKAHFVKWFFEKLSYCAINFTLAEERDHQLVGKTYDLCAGITKTLPDTVLIRAVSFRHGDFSAVDRNNIITSVRSFKDEPLRLMKVDNDNGILAADLCLCRRRIIGRQQNQCEAHCKDSTDCQKPVFVFHHNHLAEKLWLFCPFFW